SCPCGSGKKFKVCCIGKSSGEGSLSVHERLKLKFLKFNKTSAIKMLGALQTYPQNHSQVYRIKVALQAAIASKAGNGPQITVGDLKRIFETDLPNYGEVGSMEDPQEALFTHLIATHGGNFIVYPEIFEDGFTCLKNLLDTIFLTDNELPEQFKNEVFVAYRLLLGLSNLVATRLGHKRYITSPNRHHQSIFLPINEGLLDHMNAITFSYERIFSGDQEYRASEENILNEFLCTEKDAFINETDFDKSPVNTKPLYLSGEEIIVCSVSSVVTALVGFIIRKLLKQGLVSLFTAIYKQALQEKIAILIGKMGFYFLRGTPELPENHYLSGLDAIFRFDSDKIAYMRIIPDLFNSYEDYHFTRNNKIFEKTVLKKRQKEITNTYIPESYPGSEVFIISIYAGSGREFSPMVNSDGIPEVAMTMAEFERLIESGDIDSLSLWKFKKAETEFLKDGRFLSFSFLDSYTFYKDHNYSFYFSDDYKASNLHLEIGYANEFRLQTHLKQDLHLVPLLTTGMIEVVKRFESVEIPIYKPLSDQYKPRRLVKNFMQPIWVHPRFDGNNDANSFYTSIMEACSFWLWQVAPLINKFLVSLGKAPITIELVLNNPDNLIDRERTEISWQEVQGKFEVGTNGEDVAIYIPDEFQDMVYLKNNQADRILLMALMGALSGLLKEKGLSPIPGHAAILE
ncbi:MAG: SEC-C domain-containing protein, partial [Sphingobacteriaceae bacterium]